MKKQKAGKIWTDKVITKLKESKLRETPIIIQGEPRQGMSYSIHRFHELGEKLWLKKTKKKPHRAVQKNPIIRDPEEKEQTRLEVPA